MSQCLVPYYCYFPVITHFISLYLSLSLSITHHIMPEFQISIDNDITSFACYSPTKDLVCLSLQEIYEFAKYKIHGISDKYSCCTKRTKEQIENTVIELVELCLMHEVTHATHYDLLKHEMSKEQIEGLLNIKYTSDDCFRMHYEYLTNLCIMDLDLNVITNLYGSSDRQYLQYLYTSYALSKCVNTRLLCLINYLFGEQSPNYFHLSHKL